MIRGPLGSVWGGFVGQLRVSNFSTDLAIFYDFRVPERPTEFVQRPPVSPLTIDWPEHGVASRGNRGGGAAELPLGASATLWPWEGLESLVKGSGGCLLGGARVVSVLTRFTKRLSVTYGTSGGRE